MIYSDFVALLALLISPLLVFLLIRRRKDLKEKTYKTVSFFWYVFAFLVAIFFYFFLVYSVFGTLSLIEVFSNYDAFYTLNSKGTAWVFLIFNFLFFFMLYDVYQGSVENRKIALYVMTLAVVALTGGRSIIVVLMAFLFFIVVVLNRVKINPFKYFAILFLAGGVFLGNATLRSGDMQAYLEGATKFDFNSAFILNDVIDYVDSNGPDYFVSLEDFYYFFIPRSFAPEKPVSTAETRLVFPEAAARSTNYTVGIYANTILNFGYFGIIILPIFIFLLNMAYFYSSSTELRNPMCFLLLFLSFYSIQFIRGGIVNARFLIFIIAIGAACSAWHLLSRRIYYERRYKTL